MTFPFKHKFKNVPTEADGYRFSSKKEANYFRQLCLARKSGELLFFLRQVPFHIKGGIVYRADFLEFWKSGDIRIVDVKGFKTEGYKIKKRLVESEYPVTILEV